MDKVVWRAAFVGEKYVQVLAESMIYIEPTASSDRGDASEAAGRVPAVLFYNGCPGHTTYEEIALFPAANLLGVTREDSIVFVKKADDVIKDIKDKNSRQDPTIVH